MGKHGILTGILYVVAIVIVIAVVWTIVSVLLGLPNIILQAFSSMLDTLENVTGLDGIADDLVNAGADPTVANNFADAVGNTVGIIGGTISSALGNLWEMFVSGISGVFGL